jgi:hypothetical protein
MASVRTDISTISSDVPAIRNLGATPSADPSSAIDAGNKALTDAQNAINWATNRGTQIVKDANSLSKENLWCNAIASRFCQIYNLLAGGEERRLAACRGTREE